MNDEFIYMKKRKEFGRYCAFDDVEPKILGAIERNPDCADLYVEQTVLNVTLDNIPSLSEHSVNTARVQTKNRGMYHQEGGWPKEIDASEAQDKEKWRKRLEKDPLFTQAVKTLCSSSTKFLEQNITMDLFEHYFLDEDPEPLVDNFGVKTMALFKDPTDEKRSVTKIGWHPEGPTKLVGSYSNLNFQRMTDDMPLSSFVWDINDRNGPLTELRTQSPMICCQYNHKNSDLLVAGCYNGIVNWYDLRKGPSAVGKSVVETSHYDPVYDIVWLQSKSGYECASVSSDGRLLFWDVREMDAPMDTCILNDGGKHENHLSLGGVSLEWMQEAGPTKYLVGTETGITLSCTKKPKKAVEVNAWFGLEDKGGHGKHFGPVYAVKRNPFHPKFFLTVGDWTARMWMEELKGPMITTPFSPAYLSSAAWSPTRPGVFFLTRQDGYLDSWDYYYRMNEVVLSHKVSDHALTSINVQAQGSLVAVGDADGCISLLQLCDGLVNPQPNEKSILGQIFDRETKREKNLESIRKASAGHKKTEEAPKVPTTVDTTEYDAREKAFFTEVGIQGDDLSTRGV